MSEVHDQANSRLPLLAPDELNREQQDLYDRIAGTMLPWAGRSGFKAVDEAGRLLGPFNALLYNPELGAAHLDLIGTEGDSTGLDAKTREVVILTVGAAFESPYELYAHRAVAAKAGLAQADIESLATGSEPAGLSSDEMTAYRFVRELVATHKVSEPVYTTAIQVFGYKCLVDMVHLVGVYLAVAAMLNAFAVPVPQEK